MSQSARAPTWMRLAQRDVGTREKSGAVHNPKILAYYKLIGQSGIKRDEVAWCAAFVGACLERSGITSTRSLMARSYQRWGQKLTRPRRGCIVVLSRTANPTFGHVGFFVRETEHHVVLLGGNQSNAVNERRYAKSRVLGYRWPNPATVKEHDALDPRFETALAHVLEFEGGFSDHHADPGGPTYRGITIGLLAMQLGSRLKDWRRKSLIDGVKALTLPQIRTIYHQQFWRTTSAQRLPAGVDMMVFDAAVQHGPKRAIRMLQRAVDVEADGEIGPITRAAVSKAAPEDIVRHISAARDRFYRSLKHFKHFGRGWIRRLTSTTQRSLDAAEKRSSPRTTSQTQPQSKDTTRMEQSKKWWAESLTLWGTFITALSTVLPI
ncbi:MAG: TIGR02594 family protein, partial [Pseudomonadota bacterium]